MINRFKKDIVKKKKWEEDLEKEEGEEGNLTEVLKEYKPKRQDCEEEKQQQGEMNNPDPLIEKPLNPVQPSPLLVPAAKKKKQFQWMSDSDSQPHPLPNSTIPNQPTYSSTPIDLFIINIPLKATSSDITQYLQKYGKVIDIFIPLIEGTEIHKGKAFVQFVEKEGEGESVLEVEEHKVKGGVVGISSSVVWKENKREEEERDERKGKRGRSKSRSRERRRGRDMREIEQQQQEQQQQQEEQEQQDEGDDQQNNQDEDYNQQEENPSAQPQQSQSDDPSN